MTDNMQNEIKIKLMYGASPEEAARYLPTSVKPWLKIVKDAVGEILIFTSVNKEGETIGLSIFMTYKASPFVALLLYVNVKEEYQGQGCGIAMIRQGQAYLKKHGYQMLETIVVPDMHIEGYLEKEGFSEVRKEVYMLYHLADLRTSKLSESFEQLRPLMKNVKRFSQISDEEIASFRELVKRKHMKVDIAKLDAELSGFYVDNGKILGYLSFCLYESHFLTQIDRYISGAQEAKYAYATILSEIIERAFSEDSEDFKLSLYLNDMSQCQLLKQLLGDPLEEVETSIYAQEL